MYDGKTHTLGPNDGIVFSNGNIVIREVDGFNAFRLHKKGRTLLIYRKRYEKVIQPENLKKPNIVVNITMRKMGIEDVEWLSIIADVNRYKEVFYDTTIRKGLRSDLYKLVEPCPSKDEGEEVLEIAEG
jgi:hypothetical protein